MKKPLRFIAALVLLCLLAACAPAVSPLPSRSSQSVSAPSVSLAASSSTPAPLASSAAQQTPNAEEFIKMFRSTMFSFWVPRGYETTQKIPAGETTAWEMWGLLTWTRQWLDTGSMDEHGKQTFTQAELEAISQDVLGYVYDLSAIPGHTAGEPIFFVYGFGPGLSFQPVDESYTEAGGVITIDAVIEEIKPGDVPQNIAKWTMRYTFQYLPENNFPYRLLKTELVDGSYPAHY